LPDGRPINSCISSRAGAINSRWIYFPPVPLFHPILSDPGHYAETDPSGVSAGLPAVSEIGVGRFYWQENFSEKTDCSEVDLVVQLYPRRRDPGRMERERTTVIGIISVV
jgi:hypothetical protein